MHRLGVTAVSVAAVCGNSGALDILLEVKTNRDKPRPRGATPLFNASQKKHLVLVEALNAEKADVNLTITQHCSYIKSVHFTSTCAILICIFYEAMYRGVVPSISSALSRFAFTSPRNRTNLMCPF